MIHENVVHITDWFPTLLKIAQVEDYETSVKGIDGIDQSGDLFGNDTMAKRTMTVHDLNILQSGKHYGAVQIEGGWKLVQNGNGISDLQANEYNLFNIDIDPEEKLDFKNDFSDTYEELKTMLEVN